MSELDRYDYELPRDLIAQAPLHSRVDARLMVLNRAEDTISHRYVRDLPELLCEGDCLVINNTRVIPARLVGFRTETGGHWEGLFLESGPGGVWRIIGKTRGKLREHEAITLLDCDGREATHLELLAKQPDGAWIAKPDAEADTLSILEQVGRVPLPPYIRGGEMIDSDRESYQTVFAEQPGAIAAPTAGLHFTDRLLRQLAEHGVDVCRVTLHVGAGTFRPIATETLAEHHLDAEWGRIDQPVIDQLEACRRRGGRVVAVGTTSVRLLETAAADGSLKPYTGKTDLFIRPPFRFHAIDAMMTNFHLPKTTLLVLVSTFGGHAIIQRAYQEAIREQYRFYSYGDAMLIL